MPRSQLNEVLKGELGSEWTSKLQSFDYEPMAAASIGQVISPSLFSLRRLFGFVLNSLFGIHFIILYKSYP